MKVDELRTALNKYDTIALKEIIVTLYKKIPKMKREEDGLDELLQNYSQEKAKAPMKEQLVDFYTLSANVEQFIEYADQQYYFAPNQYVRKEKRSKWRLEVKRFIKELLTVQGEDGEEAAKLLANIYMMLSYACNYYIFSTDNPFSAVGYKQTELLRTVISKIFYNGFDETSVKTAVFLSLDSNVDRETLHSDLLAVLLDILKTPESKQLALTQCTAFYNEYSAFQTEKEFFRYSGDVDRYRKDEHKNYAVELYLQLKFGLYEYDDGIAYFWKNFIQRDKEVSLYCLLKYLTAYKLNDLWILEYEKACASGIKPRDSLLKDYADKKVKN